MLFPPSRLFSAGQISKISAVGRTERTRSIIVRILARNVAAESCAPWSFVPSMIVTRSAPRLSKASSQRCRKPCHQGKRQTRNVQLPRVHAHQRERSQRQVHADTKDPPGSDDGNSESHQRRSAKALALLNPRTGKMAQESGSGIPELSLGTGQLPHHAEVQDTRNKPLAPGAQAQEPEG